MSARTAVEAGVHGGEAVGEDGVELGRALGARTPGARRWRRRWRRGPRRCCRPAGRRRPRSPRRVEAREVALVLEFVIRLFGPTDGARRARSRSRRRRLRCRPVHLVRRHGDQCEQRQRQGPGQLRSDRDAHSVLLGTSCPGRDRPESRRFGRVHHRPVVVLDEAPPRKKPAPQGRIRAVRPMPRGRRRRRPPRWVAGRPARAARRDSGCQASGLEAEHGVEHDVVVRSSSAIEEPADGVGVVDRLAARRRRGPAGRRGRR